MHLLIPTSPGVWSDRGHVASPPGSSLLAGQTGTEVVS